MSVAETFTVPVRGVGKPDYSKEIALGQVRPGLTLKYGQRLKIVGITFSTIVTPVTTIALPLAAGDTAHLIDYETGSALPITLAAGYNVDLVQITYSYTQDAVLRFYISTPALGIPLVFAGNLGTKVSGLVDFLQQIVGLSTSLFDPPSTYSHDIDLTIKNLGGAALEGACSVVAIEEKVGTEPYPTTKIIQCKFCNHKWEVPMEITVINCPSCGELNIYFDFSRFRGTA